MMGVLFGWLRHPLDFTDCTTQTEELNLAYDAFKADFIDSTLTYHGLPVRFNQHTKDGREKWFWHMVAGEEPFRNYSRFRAARLVWCKSILDNVSQPMIFEWDEIDGDREKRYIWFRPKYIIVLEPRDNYWWAVTAYPTERPHTQRRYSKRLAKAQKENMLR